MTIFKTCQRKGQRKAAFCLCPMCKRIAHTTKFNDQSPVISVSLPISIFWRMIDECSLPPLPFPLETLKPMAIVFGDRPKVPFIDFLFFFYRLSLSTNVQILCAVRVHLWIQGARDIELRTPFFLAVTVCAIYSWCAVSTTNNDKITTKLCKCHAFINDIDSFVTASSSLGSSSDLFSRLLIRSHHT